MMEVRNLSYHYKGCPEVLKDVSFDIEPGKFLAILGNNGVGKSTLLKCFNHILKPDSGAVCLDGENLLEESPREHLALPVFSVHQSRNGADDLRDSKGRTASGFGHTGMGRNAVKMQDHTLGSIVQGAVHGLYHALGHTGSVVPSIGISNSFFRQHSGTFLTACSDFLTVLENQIHIPVSALLLQFQCQTTQ